MTRELFACYEDARLEAAARIMEEKQVRRVPVLNDSKRLVGIVSVGDRAVRIQDEHRVVEGIEPVCEPE